MSDSNGRAAPADNDDEFIDALITLVRDLTAELDVTNQAVIRLGYTGPDSQRRTELVERARAVLRVVDR
jgi:predicted NBD/HSP70 family sugar kinase